MESWKILAVSFMLMSFSLILSGQEQHSYMPELQRSHRQMPDVVEPWNESNVPESQKDIRESDERTAFGISCTVDQYRCRNNECIKKSQLCDGLSDCSDNSDEDQCDIHGNNIEKNLTINSTKEKLTNWLISQRRNVMRNGRWGSEVARIGIALYLSNPEYFTGDNTIGNELSYEIENHVLIGLLRSVTYPLSESQLAMYICALLITCHDPRDFHGVNLVSKLRYKVNLNKSNITSTLAFLALCKTDETLTEQDAYKVLNAFYSQQRPLWKSNQALALIALSCLAQKPSYADGLSEIINDMSLRLKQEQNVNGSFGNVHTTALTMQALIASGKLDGGWNIDGATNYLIKSQNAEDGSYGNFLNSYYVLPVLYHKSLLNISSSHCTKNAKNTDAEYLGDIGNKIGKKIRIKYSLWFGDELDFVRSISLRVIANTNFFDIMKIAKSLDERFNFAYNLVDSKPYIYSLSGYQDDPENELFWFFYRANATGYAYDFIKKSPIEVLPKDSEEYIMWYKKGNWTNLEMQGRLIASNVLQQKLEGRKAHLKKR